MANPEFEQILEEKKMDWTEQTWKNLKFVELLKY